ncbi:MAG: 5'-nucleosidase [Myxococcaceae bacterium]|nr:5'-nucleosidase [Myxococcaceae bacterium]MCA3016290.1 5'-nucleosidase [Myxococcaceae bacterium]
MRPDEVLVVVALLEEVQAVFDGTGVRVVRCGVGKVNATYATLKALGAARPALVLNVGTAGSPVFPAHTLVECTRFVQRDIDASPLGYPRGTTPFDDTPPVLSVPRRFPALPEGVLGTGDDFETTLLPSADGLPHAPTAAPHLPRPTVIDMEGFAIAKVCALEGVPLASLKYVTDGSDSSASSDWAQNLPRAAARFREVFDRLLAG